MPDGLNQSKMKTRIIIYELGGKIHSVHTSGESEVYLVKQGQGLDSVTIIEPDEFEIGTAHKAFIGKAGQFLKEKKV